MRFGPSPAPLLTASRARLANSTALAGLALGAAVTLSVLVAPVTGALAAPGLGGAGSGTGGDGGNGGSAPGFTGAIGADGTGGGTGGTAGNAGTSGGGGGGGVGGTTGQTSVTTAIGTNGGAGGVGSGASSANGGGGGGGGEGGAGVASATGGTLAVSALGGTGGAGGAAGPGATPGNGGDGGEGVVITGAGQTLTNNGVITGGSGGAAGGLGATGGSGGPGVLGIGDTLIVQNNGTITGGLNGSGVGRGNAVTFFGTASDLFNNANGIITGGISGVDDLVNNGLINLSGGNATVGSLSGTTAGATISNGGTLTVGGNDSSTIYAGQILDGAGQTSLVKTGAGELILTGASVYTGPTTVSTGVLHIGAGGSITGSPITNNATFLVDAGAAVTSPTIVNNAYLQVDGTVTATTSFTNNAVLAANAPITTPSFLNAGQVAGVLTLNGLADATNVAGGYIQNGLSTSGNATFANAGTVGSGGLVVQNRAGTLAVTNTGTFDGYASSLAGTTTTIANSGTWFVEGASSFAGPATITNSGTFQASGGSVTGLSTFNNSETGLLFLAAPLSGSIATFNNAGSQAAGGGVLLQGRSFPTVGTFNNNGYLRVPAAGGAAADVTLAAGTFNNQAKGTIDLTGNGLATDRLTIAGNYTGTAGSRLAIDANLSPGGAASDTLRVTGTVSGTTALVVNRLDDPRTASYSTKTVPVLVAGGGSGQLVLGAPIQGSGITTYELQNTAPGSYQLVSRIDTTAAAGAPNLFRSLLNSLNIGFYQSMSSLFGAASPGIDDARLSSGVSTGNTSWAQLTTRPAFSEPDLGPAVTPDTMAAGVWANGGGGELVLRGTDTATFAGADTRASASRTEVNFAGVQLGLDGGWFNIDNSGLNVRLGVTGGSVGGTATQTLGTPTRNVFDVPFVGVYAVVTDGAFFADVSYRHDFIRGELTNRFAGLNAQKTNLGADTISGTAGYRFSLGDLVGGEGSTFIEPSATVIYTQTGRLDVPVTGGSVRTGDLDTLLGRLGVRIGTTLRPNGSVVLQPFVAASVWNEFGDPQRTRFVSSNITVDPNAFVPITGTRLGTFGQAGGGLSMQVVDAPVSGFVRGDVRFGDRIEGYSINGGARYQF